MKILIYGDNHFCQYSSILRSRGNKYSTRLENQIESINWVEQLAIDEKCDLIVNLGDFFDRPDLNAEEITALKEINWSDIKHYFLVGNHELGMNDLSYNSAQVLSNIPNSKIIDRPYCETKINCEIVYLPYILENNRKEISEYIKQARLDEINNNGDWSDNTCRKLLILSHNDISGIRYGQYLSQIGFNVNDISNNCDLFINGHIHNQTQINEKILNLGNLTGQNFSEDAEKYSHCAAILNTDNLKIDLIINPKALNFYKLELYTKEDFNRLDKLDSNAVLSIKTYQSLVDDLKVKLNDKKDVLTYRVITVPDPSKLNESKEVTKIVTMDHIEQFKKYILENIENTDLLKEELDLIK